MFRKIVRRLAASARYRFVGEPISETERAFLAENRSFWNMMRGSEPEGDECVLVEWVNHEAILLANAAIGAIAAQNCQMLFLVDSGRRSRIRQIMESYPGAKFENLGGWRFRLFSAAARLWSVWISMALKTPGDLLNLEVRGMPIGAVVYDVYLFDQSRATVRSVDSEAIRILSTALALRMFYMSTIKRHKIKKAVISQMMGLFPGILAQCLLTNRIEVLNRVGSHQILMRKYASINAMGDHPCTPTRDIFDRMLKSEDAAVQMSAQEYLEKRFTGGVSRLDAALAFGKSKVVYTDRESFCREYDLDPALPIVFVMLHAFTDYPHWNFPRKMLYRDYYEWFVRTIEVAQSTTSVNWIVKEHPTQKYYPTKDLDLDGFMVEYERMPNIRFLNAAAPLNTGSLRYVAQAVVTAVGTAGVEFAAWGVPCVLAGEGAYSGFGFTIDSASPEEYEATLRSIATLSRLTREQISRARILAYFFFCLGEKNVFHFCPSFHDDELSAWKPEFGQILWGKATAGFRDPSKRALLIQQARDLGAFCADRGRTQWLDYDLHPYLRDPVGTIPSGSRHEPATHT